MFCPAVPATAGHILGDHADPPQQDTALVPWGEVQEHGLTVGGLGANPAL